MLGFFRPVGAEAPKMTPEETLNLKMVDWLNRLSYCESGHNNKAVNPYDGGSRSVGLLQFKDSTWKYYSTHYRLGYTAEDIWNGDKQIHMALLMLKENTKNQHQWHNCAVKIGLL